MENETLIIPALHGQFRLWKSQFAIRSDRAEKVIQLGNIIGCNDISKDKAKSGPNEAILKLMAHKREHHSNWVQIVGINEIAALNFPEEWTNDESAQILRRMWLSETPIFKIAAVDKGRLITHGGLTYGEWVSIGRPETAVEAAELINEKYMRTIYQGSSFLLNDPPNFSANPIWAHPAMELYPSWITAVEDPPFDQLHGGRGMGESSNRQIMSEKHSIVNYADSIRFRNYGSLVTIKGKQFTCVDMELDREIISQIPRPKTIYIEKIN